MSSVSTAGWRSGRDASGAHVSYQAFVPGKGKELTRVFCEVGYQNRWAFPFAVWRAWRTVRLVSNAIKRVGFDRVYCSISHLDGAKTYER
jgi:hypothetical protein